MRQKKSYDQAMSLNQGVLFSLDEQEEEREWSMADAHPRTSA